MSFGPTPLGPRFRGDDEPLGAWIVVSARDRDRCDDGSAPRLVRCTRPATARGDVCHASAEGLVVVIVAQPTIKSRHCAVVWSCLPPGVETRVTV